MSKTTDNNSFQEEEIDLGMLFLKIFQLLKRNLIIIIIFFCAGLIGGYLHFELQTPAFKSSMILDNTILNLPSGSSLVILLDELIEDGNYEQVSKKLNISIEQSKHLKGIAVENIYDKNVKDEIKTFKISINVTNTRIIDNIQKGLIDYLENTPFVKKRIELKKGNINAQISFLKDEMKEIEEIKNEMLEGNFLKDKSNNLLLFDPMSVYQQAIDLFNKELELQRDLQLVENFHVIQGFTTFKKPNYPKLTSSLLTGLLNGLILNFFVLLIIEFRRYTRNLKQEVLNKAT